MRTVAIRGEFITLGQILKLSGVVGTGGEIKSFLANANIRVNGERENRRGRKLRPGDVVVIAGDEEIRLSAEPAEGEAGEDEGF